MFRFTRKPSSWGDSQYLAKITHLVQCGYIELAQEVVSVLAAYYNMQPEHLQLLVRALYIHIEPSV